MKLENFTTYTLITEASKTLKISLPKSVQAINKLFKKNHKSLYLVGGACRDFLLGHKPKDFDLATDAIPSEVQRILDSGNISNFPKGEAFGVISAVTDEGEFEIATFREETYRDSGFLTFIEYINKLKPEEYEKRLHIFTDLSTK